MASVEESMSVGGKCDGGDRREIARERTGESKNKKKNTLKYF